MDNTLTKLQATITEVAEAVGDRREAFFAHPEDVETIHRFRTNARTLRSLVAFVKPWHNKRQNAEIQLILRDTVRHTSLLRELDVLEKHVRERADLSSQLLSLCEGEAAAERARVREALSLAPVTASFEQAMSQAKNVAWRRCVRDGLPADAVRARFDAMVASVGDDLADLDLTDPERTHDVRKRTKRARYVAERCAHILGVDSVEVARGMNAHQDELGEICDARANVRLIGEFLRRDLPDPVVRDLTLMLRQNEAFLESVL